MAPVRAAGARRWCLTLNNPTDEEVQAAKRLEPNTYHYAIIGREVGESGTPHLQGFLHFKQKQRLTALKKLFSRAHWEKARGSDSENQAYCSKDGDVILTIGQPVRGNVTELSEAVAAVKAGRGMRDVALEFPEVYVKHGRGLRDLALLIGRAPRDFKTDVIVLTGPPGCGKSRWAAEQEGTKYYKMKGDWWDGYSHEDIVIIDDFYGWLPYCELLRLCDRYPHKVPVKGSFVEFVSKKIIITSNKTPDQWYRDEYDKSALYRRITRLLFFNGDTMTDMPAFMLPHPINF
ncbi:replication-associated protein [Penguin circovirus]|uniref:Replication-associated protein n=1 Tax=Penguin circovirus TaxID=2676049 RepID=A0A649Z5H8_9CIRC|nr:replication-associated protein [Penguin circovirus]QGM50355.1 replication-associated protein [Penguin circovirus]QGM50359.1 replication-associated protein [Penguin circovirus]